MASLSSQRIILPGKRGSVGRSKLERRGAMKMSNDILEVSGSSIALKSVHSRIKLPVGFLFWLQLTRVGVLLLKVQWRP